jgi:hypothetical protein
MWRRTYRTLLAMADDELQRALGPCPETATVEYHYSLFFRNLSVLTDLQRAASVDGQRDMLAYLAQLCDAALLEALDCHL